MNEDKLKDSFRNIGNNLVVAGIVATFFSAVPLFASLTVITVSAVFIDIGIT